MSEYRLIAEHYLLPTPAGAYYAVSSDKKDMARKFIFSLLAGSESQLLTLQRLQEMLQMESEQASLELLKRLLKLGWVQGESRVRSAPEGTLEERLPTLLSKLSASGKALLADQQGFYLGTHGFSHESAEELSALSADLASLHQRHAGLLKNNVGIDSTAWAVVNACGDSALGFWPLYIGEQRFVLVLSGIPQLNQSLFMELVWVLSKRYAKTDE